MAHSDKNILITPNIGSTTADPKIVFSGADASTGAQNITLNVYPTNSGTLSFEGSAGQLFSITNSMSGTIYSVNDVSGIPSIEVLDTGLVKLAQYSGNVLLGTGTDNGTDKLQVNGSILGTTLKGTTLTSTVATGTAPLTVTSTTMVSNLNAQYWNGNAFSSYLNQAVLTTSTPTFADVYTNGWFRNNSSGNGLYNQATTQHFYSDDDNYWNIAGGTEANGLRFRDEHAGTIRGYVYANNSNEIGFLDNSANWTLRMAGGVAYATTFSGALSGNATTATNLSNTGTVTLASATESNSINITAPTYTSDTPVKLLNFDWYSNVFSIGNIRSGNVASNGLGFYYTASGGSRTEIARFGTDSSFNVIGALKQNSNQVLHAGNYSSYASPLAGSSSLTTTGTVTSGTWSGSFGAVSGANLTSLNASNLGSGTVPTARLGTGTANSTTYLRGDNTWATPSASAAAGGFWENDITISTNYTITTNKNAMTAGPVTVANGVTITVPNGSTWTVV